MMRDLIICLQEATLYFIHKKSWTPKNPSECFLNPPCGCANPGKTQQCEDCVHLEACLSHCKLHGADSKQLKIFTHSHSTQLSEKRV
ncbi:hypothetical protein NIES4074_20210 [Cylindrospermum sp. NIES-4074]|jgi:hypothetical protein|nr:hypothetical protein NIES4074_20210 [Cylindrospermum sp. NIES-4074]